MTGTVYELPSIEPFALGWAIGVIEGEGSIAAWPRSGRTRGFHVRLCVSSTDVDVLERIRAIFQVGSINRQDPNGRNALATKPCYAWQVQSIPVAQTILRAIYPHLSERRQGQARQALAVKSLYGPGRAGRGGAL